MPYIYALKFKKIKVLDFSKPKLISRQIINNEKKFLNNNFI